MRPKQNCCYGYTTQYQVQYLLRPEFEGDGVKPEVKPPGGNLQGRVAFKDFQGQYRTRLGHKQNTITLYLTHSKVLLILNTHNAPYKIVL